MPPVIPMSILIHCGHSILLVECEAKLIIGFLIVLFVLWVVNSIFIIYKYYDKSKDEGIYLGFIEWYFIGPYEFLGFFNYWMAFLYGILILIWLGSLVAQYL